MVLPDLVQNYLTVIVQPKDATSVFEVNKMVNQLRPLSVCKVKTELLIGVFINHDLSLLVVIRPYIGVIFVVLLLLVLTKREVV